MREDALMLVAVTADGWMFRWDAVSGESVGEKVFLGDEYPTTSCGVSGGARRVGAVLVAAVVVRCGIWFFYGRSGTTYPHQYPGRVTDMTLERGLADHHVALPEETSGVRYSANSIPEGEILVADYSLPCLAVSPMMTKNGFLAVSDELHLSDFGVLDQAESLGWRQRPGDIVVERPRDRKFGGQEFAC